MRIAFIGLGNMGAPMARNLIKAGHQLNLFDLNKTVLAELAELGGQVSASPKEAAASSDLVITMLPAAAHVRSVYLGDDGVLAGVRPGTPTVDCSTIDPQTAREVSKAAAAKGVDMGDAPVSGGTGGAAAGTLTFMVGASAELFATLKPVLEQMGRNIVHCGEVGTGQIAKICNNLLLGISMIGVSKPWPWAMRWASTPRYWPASSTAPPGVAGVRIPTTPGQASSRPPRLRAATPAALAPS